MTKKWLLATLIVFGPVSAGAVEFDFLHTEVSGDWETARAVNQNTMEQFCVAQSASADGTVIRLNFYMSGDAFLEVYNAGWQLRQGDARFQLQFDATVADLRGTAWPDAYTHDFTDENMMLTLLGLFIESNTLTVRNSNNAPLAEFSLSGSQRAIQLLESCRAGEF